jgi:hypothetical protein
MSTCHTSRSQQERERALLGTFHNGLGRRTRTDSASPYYASPITNIHTHVWGPVTCPPVTVESSLIHTIHVCVREGDMHVYMYIHLSIITCVVSACQAAQL